MGKNFAGVWGGLFSRGSVLGAVTGNPPIKINSGLGSLFLQRGAVHIPVGHTRIIDFWRVSCSSLRISGLSRLILREWRGPRNEPH